MITCDSIATKHEFSTFVDVLNYRAQAQCNEPIYTLLADGETETGSLTYQELGQQAQAIASLLQTQIPPGSRVLLVYPPGLDFIAAFFGCLYAGVVAVPAYPPRRNQNMSRLQAIVASSQATVALTTTAVLANISDRCVPEPELAHLRWLATDNLDRSLAASYQTAKINRDTLAFIQYTSGSTGTPKGVMVTHGNLLHNSTLINQCFADTPQSRGVTWLPPYHDMGLIGGILQPLYIGASTVLMPSVAFIQKPYRWLLAISRYRATTSGGPNFAYDLCLQKITPAQRETLDLSSWELAFTGAEPVRAETLQQFVETFAACGFRREAFLPCYGMAETTLIVSGSVKTAPPVIRNIDGVALEQNRVVEATGKEGELNRQIVGCGQCLETVAIVNPDTCTPVGANQVGEIWVAGASVASGYWYRPEETERTFHAYLATGEGPFLRTGDLGFLQDGELFITGRSKDLLIIRGQNHYPQDIELTTQRCHPALRPGCGAAFTVDVKGQERLVVVQEIERNYLRKLNVNEVVGKINHAVAAQHGLQVYAAVLVKTGSIPKTSSGKIQRYACRAGFKAGTLNVVDDWSENPQGKVKFLQLQAEVESVLQQLSAGKQQ